MPNSNRFPPRDRKGRFIPYKYSKILFGLQCKSLLKKLYSGQELTKEERETKAGQKAQQTYNNSFKGLMTDIKKQIRKMCAELSNSKYGGDRMK